jgi:hypothetical protein
MGNSAILLMVSPLYDKWYQNLKNGFEIKKCIKNDKIQNKKYHNTMKDIILS